MQKKNPRVAIIKKAEKEKAGEHQKLNQSGQQGFAWQRRRRSSSPAPILEEDTGIAQAVLPALFLMWEKLCWAQRLLASFFRPHTNLIKSGVTITLFVTSTKLVIIYYP